MMCTGGNTSYMMMMMTIFQFLQQDTRFRLATIEDLKQHEIMAAVNWDNVYEKNIKPSFVPPVS